MARNRQGLILGVDIGSSKIAVSLWADGRRQQSERFRTLDGGPAPNLARVVELARELAGEESIERIGISGGGPVDPGRGLLLQIPNSVGWENVPVVDNLSLALSAPAAIENDANACALAEWQFGAGKGASNVIFLTFSTGLGAGLILDGRLYRGHRFLAGEVGHQIIHPGGARCGCGQRGCLEAYASGVGIAHALSRKRERNPDMPVDARELVERAKTGDPAALDFLREIAVPLAHGISNLIFVLNPERVILGTIAVAAGDLLLDPVRAELERWIWPSLREGLEILPAGLGAELGDMSAYAVALSAAD
jgi:glucokinase